MLNNNTQDMIKGHMCHLLLSIARYISKELEIFFIGKGYD